MTGPSLGSDPTALRLLATLLRLRPASRSELPGLRGMPTRDLDQALEQLVRAGFLEIDGDRLKYHAPDRAVEAQARALADLVALLPELTREWRQGSAPSTSLDVDLVHGHEEQWRAWSRHAAITPPNAPLNLYPTLDVLRDVIAPALDEAITPYRAAMGQARAVIPASAVVTGDDRAVVDLLAAAGTRIRLARRLDSWVYSDPDVLCALPLVWGEHPPTTIMIVRDPAIRALTAAYAELVWTAAAPYRVPRPEWHDVLRLLALGMSDRAIAAAQGTSLRTVERRIAEAMTHYRVSTRFELGIAWSADRGPEPGSESADQGESVEEVDKR